MDAVANKIFGRWRIKMCDRKPLATLLLGKKRVHEHYTLFSAYTRTRVQFDIWTMDVYGLELLPDFVKHMENNVSNWIAVHQRKIY